MTAPQIHDPSPALHAPRAGRDDAAPTNVKVIAMHQASSEQLPIVQEFMRYLLDERHFSPYTSRCYGVDLRQYAEFLTEELNIRVTRAQEMSAFARAAERRAPAAAAGHDVLATLNPATIRVHFAARNWRPVN